MAYDLSALSTYTKDNKDQLTTSLVTGAKTISMIKAKGNVMLGVKSSENIHIMDTDAVFQTGGSCGFNSQGTTAFTNRAVTIGKIKVNESLCPKSLERYWTQLSLPTGSKYDSVPFEQKYSDKKIKRIHSQLEKAVWQGDTASGNGNLNKFDGFLKLIDADGSVTEANAAAFIGIPITAATGITEANVIKIFQAVYKAVPEKVIDNADGSDGEDLAVNDPAIIWCGVDVARTYRIALANANLFHYSSDEAASNSFYIPGTDIMVQPVPGLSGTSRIVAMRLGNMYYGTDMIDEEENFEIFFAKEADEVRFIAEWKSGVNYAFGDEIAKFTLVP